MGWELGTVEVELEEPASRDELLGGMTSVLRVHVSHTQSVLRLPQGAVRLARSSRDSNQVFRVGRTSWGVQFHPEFDSEIVQAYIHYCRKKLIAEGQDPDRLLRDSQDPACGAEILQRFAQVTRKVAA
jgi:GMP synthase (glutamine-hydrolysing)